MYEYLDEVDIDPNEPHQYEGDEVDVGVGVIYAPCNICGLDKSDIIHE